MTLKKCVFTALAIVLTTSVVPAAEGGVAEELCRRSFHILWPC